MKRMKLVSADGGSEIEVENHRVAFLKSIGWREAAQAAKAPPKPNPKAKENK